MFVVREQLVAMMNFSLHVLQCSGGGKCPSRLMLTVIISGLKETFIKSSKVERTNKAEIRPEEPSEKTGELME